jgi:hypothetical protein
MKQSNSLALIVAYYLSKYDDLAYEQLGFKKRQKTAAHEELGRILGVNSNSVKNMRDEFDPLHDNPRAGWHQRPLRPSRAKVVEQFQEMSQEELRDLVLEILTNPDFSHSDDFDDIIEPISKRETKRKSKPIFIVRGPTGRKAEEFFVSHHRNFSLPATGKLTDMRDQGCGYDFEITSSDKKFQIEVKGLDGLSGGIAFTSKEWDVAQKMRDSYFLVVVRNISTSPVITIIQNPASVFAPKKNVFTTVQVRWNLSDADLRKGSQAWMES